LKRQIEKAVSGDDCREREHPEAGEFLDDLAEWIELRAAFREMLK